MCKLIIFTSNRCFSYMSKENKRQKSTRFSTDLSAQKHFYSSLKLLSDRKYCNLHIYGKINNSQFLLSNVMIGENENVCILLTFRALLNEWFIDRCEIKKIKISHAINHCRKETKCGFLFSNASYLNTVRNTNESILLFLWTIYAWQFVTCYVLTRSEQH